MNNSAETLEKILFSYCSQDKTGTILIATTNNKSCQIVLDNGTIEAMTMGRTKGQEVAIELRNAGYKSSSFIEGQKLPFKEEARIDSSADILKLYDHEKEEQASLQPSIEIMKEEATTENKSKDIQQRTKPKASVESADKEVKIKKDNEDLTEMMMQLEKELQ